MKKTNLKKNSKMSFLLGGVIMTVLAVSSLGAINANALISSQLDLGDQGGEVTELQTYLSSNANLYPSGLVTGYFGQLTKAGVERFQTVEGIVSSGTPATTGYGRVGPRTQSSINAKLSGGTVSTGDIYAPVIRTMGVTTGNSTATVSWTASESSFGKVYYSISPIRISNIFDATGVFSGEPIVSGTLAQYDGAARVSHAVNINGLSSNTTYYYLVVVYDATKNVSISSPAAFQTQ